MTADEVWWLQQMLWQWTSTHGKWYYQLMTIQAIDTWWQLVKIYASWQMPKSGNFWRKHFWTENKAAKFWESPTHVAMATHGCARGRMEIKFQLCARKHIIISPTRWKSWASVAKDAPWWKNRFCLQQPPLNLLFTVTVHSSQWSSNRHGSCSAFVSTLSSLKNCDKCGGSQFCVNSI